jgi:SAM-dependent methyltransferase
MDLSQSALGLARRNFSEERASCFLVRGNMLSVPFPDVRFNAVISIGALEHFEDIDQPLREMIRLLKPGGTFCVSVSYNRHFSVQTLIDWLYHIPGTIVKHGLFRRDPLKAKAMVRSWLGGDLYENELGMENYVAAMRKLGLIDVTAVPCATIPSLRLPRFLESIYVRWLKVFCAIKRLLHVGIFLGLYGEEGAYGIFSAKNPLGTEVELEKVCLRD